MVNTNTQIKIKKNVPVPSAGKGSPDFWDQLLQKMKYGDSIVISEAQLISVRPIAKRQRVKITTRAEGSKRRLWVLGPVSNA